MTNDKNLKRSYWSVIPAEVRYCKALGGGDAKHLYGEISSLCNDRGYCWASNQYFADLYGTNARTVQRWIKQLEDNHFIHIPDKGAKRHIFLTHNLDRNLNTFTEIDYKEEVSQETVKTTGNVKKTKKPVKKEKPKKYTDQDLFLAELLLSKIIYNFPAFENKKVNIGEWADDIRKLREIDKATDEQIQFMIVWVHGGEVSPPGKPVRVFEPHKFWSGNILSTRKLREQWFDNLIPQLQTAFKKEVKKRGVADLSNKPQAVAQL